jgi:hypothetical protein
MSKVAEYYARAAQCKTRPAETTDPEFKREFVQLAQKWNDLAIQADVDGDGSFHGLSHRAVSMLRGARG